MTPKKYHLTTIKDIFDQIPEDRLDAFCGELRTAIGFHHKLKKLIADTVNKSQQAQHSPDDLVSFGGVFVWRDDKQKLIQAELDASSKLDIRRNLVFYHTEHE